MTTLPVVAEIQLKSFNHETVKRLTVLGYHTTMMMYCIFHYQDILRLTETPISNRLIRRLNKRQLKKRFGIFCKVLGLLQRLSKVPEHDRMFAMNEIIDRYFMKESIRPN